MLSCILSMFREKTNCKRIISCVSSFFGFSQETSISKWGFCLSPLLEILAWNTRNGFPNWAIESGSSMTLRFNMLMFWLTTVPWSYTSCLNAFDSICVYTNSQPSSYWWSCRLYGIYISSLLNLCGVSTNTTVQPPHDVTCAGVQLFCWASCHQLPQAPIKYLSSR